MRSNRRRRKKLFATSAHAGRRRQRDVLCAVMLSASQCDTWLTLDELAKLTLYPPASISAQLRHLRKPQFGGYQVEKRQREFGRAMRGEDFGTVWEYRLHRPVLRIFEQSARVRRRVRLTRCAMQRRWLGSSGSMLLPHRGFGQGEVVSRVSHCIS